MVHDMRPVVPASSHPCEVTVEGQEHQLPAVVVTYGHREPVLWVFVDGSFTTVVNERVTRLWWRGIP